MSVTFSFAQWAEDPRRGRVLVHGICCPHECTLNGPCEDNAIYRTCGHATAALEACGCQAFDVTLSQVNAQLVLARLGLEPGSDGDLAGDATPDDILGRALTGNIGRDDEGIPASASQLPGSARVIDCGVRPGYFTEALEAIASLAAEAKARGMLVGWC